MAAAACALLLCACATTPRSPFGGGAGEDEEILGLVGPETPQALRQVAAEPYARPIPTTCDEVERQIAELDALLGPDVDSGAGGERNLVGDWAKGAVRDLVPYRSVLRFLTGAPGRERERAAAVLAGAVRRGYLKGVRATLPCPAAPAAES